MVLHYPSGMPAGVFGVPGTRGRPFSGCRSSGAAWCANAPWRGGTTAARQKARTPARHDAQQPVACGVVAAADAAGPAARARASSW